MHSVYIHQNIFNKKIYVGYSTNPKERWYQTKSRAFNKKFKQYNEPFYNAIRRDGWNNFTHQIIEEFNSKEEALQAEMFWIEFFRSNRKVYGPDYGYNMHVGGNCPPSSIGRVHSKKYLEHMSIINRGSKNPNYGNNSHLGYRRKDAKNYCFAKNRWQVTVTENGKNKYLGLYKTEQEAIEVVANYRNGVL